jgi:hypothetical protein
MSEPIDVRAELSRAEERLAEVRARSARLERALLKPTALRNASLATLVLAALGGTFGYLGAMRAGDAHAAAAYDHAKETREDIVAMQRQALDTCKEVLQKDKNETLRCAAELDALERTLPPAREPPLRGSPKCMCQPGDPLCSCL